MSKEEVEQFLIGMGEPKFRAKQVRTCLCVFGRGTHLRYLRPLTQQLCMRPTRETFKVCCRHKRASS